MSANPRQITVSPGDQILTKVSMLVFLGVFLMGLGANRPLWPSLYRAFFVWLAVSLIAGSVRVLWKYHLYQQREHELETNIKNAKEEEARLMRERRERKDQMGELLNMMTDQSVETESLNSTQSGEAA